MSKSLNGFNCFVGVVEKTFLVRIIDDIIPESDEVFQVVLVSIEDAWK